MAGQPVHGPAQKPQASLVENRSDPLDFCGKSITDDLPALKHYLSTWYYRMKATTKLTPANLFKLISCASPFRSAAQDWFEVALTSIEEVIEQSDEADALLICTLKATSAEFDHISGDKEQQLLDKQLQAGESASAFAMRFAALAREAEVKYD